MAGGGGGGGGSGGSLYIFGWGVCHWDSKTLALYQTLFSYLIDLIDCILIDLIDRWLLKKLM